MGPPWFHCGSDFCIFGRRVHRNYVGGIERGELNVTFRVLLKVARELKCRWRSWSGSTSTTGGSGEALRSALGRQRRGQLARIGCNRPTRERERDGGSLYSG